MASREEVIKLTIESAEAAKSVKEVRDSLKAIRNQMLGVAEDSQEFHQLAAAAAELKDRVQDANEAMAAMHPDGFQAVVGFAQKAAGAVAGLQGAMALFGGESEEVQKTMMKLQAAMALTQGLESLKDMSKAWRALNAVIAANPVLAIVAAVLALGAAAAAVYDWFVEQNSEAAKLEEQAKQIEAIESRKINQLDNQLKILKAQGASEHEIYQTLMQQLDAKLRIAKANLLLAKQRAEEEDYSEEEMKAFNDAATEFGNLLAEKQVAQIEYQNWVQGERDKELEKEQTQSDKIVAIKKKEYEEMQDRSLQLQAKQVEFQKEFEVKGILPLKESTEQFAIEGEARILTFKDRMLNVQAEMYRVANNMQEKFGGQLADSTSDLFGQLANASKKNAKAQKAFSIAQAVINTYQAATKALAFYAPPASYIAAAASLVAGFAQVRNIMQTNVDSPSASGGGGGMGGGMGLAQINDQPNINSAAQPSTLLDQQGNVINQQNNQPTAYVAVTEINEVNNNVQVVENLARF